MTQEEIKYVLESFGKGGINIAGDLVINKHVEHEVGNVETGGIGIQNNYHGYDNANVSPSKQQQIENLLRQEIEAAKATKKTVKFILLPYKAAIEAGAISDTMSYDEFNKTYGCNVAKSSFSEWIKKEKFTNNEIDPLIEKFRAIMNA